MKHLTLIIIFIIIGGLLFFGIVNFYYQSQPRILTGDYALRVTILTPNDEPVQGLEVDLWTGDAQSGPPNAGYSYTDNNGTVVFFIPLGDYKVGFNSLNFPSEFINPGKKSVIVSENNTVLTIQLEEG